MKFQTKLTLCKAVFIFIAIVVCALWAFEFRIAAVVVLLIDYIFDFITRRCPFCGKHFSIVLTVKDRCPFCGKLFEYFMEAVGIPCRNKCVCYKMSANYRKRPIFSVMDNGQL